MTSQVQDQYATLISQRQLKTINTATHDPTISYRQTHKSINDKKSRWLSTTIHKCSNDEVKQEDDQPSTKRIDQQRSTFIDNRKSTQQVYLFTVGINAQCQQTWPTSTFANQHSATIGDQKHDTPQSKTANNCRNGMKRGTKCRAYLYPKPQ